MVVINHELIMNFHVILSSLTFFRCWCFNQYLDHFLFLLACLSPYMMNIYAKHLPRLQSASLLPLWSIMVCYLHFYFFSLPKQYFELTGSHASPFCDITSKKHHHTNQWRPWATSLSMTMKSKGWCFGLPQPASVQSRDNLKKGSAQPK